ASPINESVTDFGATKQQEKSIHTAIPEVKTVEVQPGFVEEFVVDHSPTQQFIEKRESLEEMAVESSPVSSSVSFEPVVEEKVFAASETAPTFAAPAPELS